MIFASSCKKNRIEDSQSYRLFLQNNAEKIIINNKDELQKFVCSPRKERKYDPLSVKHLKGYEVKGTMNYSKF
jgi:hypothetical protein